MDTVQVLHDLFADYTDVAGKCSKIISNEYAGNDLSKEISKQLSMTFITPIDREDIHSINTAQENVLNSIRTISTRIGLYHFTGVTPGSIELVSKLKSMTGTISIMLDHLSVRKGVEEQAEKVREIKMEADMLLLVVMGEIYERRTETPGDLLEIIKWSHIYDRIEDTINHTEALANVIEGITLKNA